MTTKESKKRLALAIIDFLSTSLNDGTLSQGDQESIEVAQSCISECFKVDPTDDTAMKDALGGQNLLSIYGVFEKLKSKPTAGGAAAAASATASFKKATAPTTAQIQEAEVLKSQGNSAMKQKDYIAAIAHYSDALALTPQNPIYLSNRAAAYSASNQHDRAVSDAQKALEIDPKYTKAWSRLGLAKFELEDTKGSFEAYQKGVECEGNGGSTVMRNGLESARKRLEEEEKNSSEDGADRGMGAGGMPDIGSLASMLGGGAGGPPDFGALMNNPMFASVAQNLMSNPEMMGNLLNNPKLRQMAESFGGAGAGAGRGAGGGGGMPDIASLMADPTIAEMAKNLIGSGRGGRKDGSGSGSGSGII